MRQEQGWKRHDQADQFSSPWSLGGRIRLLLWESCWALLCSWTPKNLVAWRLLWLRLFGARLIGRPFVHQRARIQMPWNLTMHDRACLGDRASAYSLGKIEIGARATVAQEAYLCSGTHDFDSLDMALVTAPVVVGSDAFVGARAFVMPGVTIGEGAVVGAASVVTRDLPPWSVCAGNPAKIIRQRSRP